MWRFTKRLFAPALAMALLLFQPAIHAWAQEPSWRSFSMSDGLPSNRITAILQTDPGTLWVGTEAGLRYFFGGKFLKEAIPADADTARVQALLTTSDGTLWVATNSGLYRRHLDGHWDARLEREAGLETADISALLQMQDGTIWIGARDGLASWDGHSWKKLNMDGQALRVNALAEAVDGQLWVAGPDQIQVIRGGTVIQIIAAEDGLPLGAELKSLLCDSHGVMWLASANGLVEFSGTKVHQIFTNYEGLGNGEIWALSEGSTELWVGTGSGLARLVGGVVQSLFTTADGLAGDQVVALTRDREGNIWAGTDRGLTRLPIGQWTVESNPLLQRASIQALLPGQPDGDYLAVAGGVAHQPPGGKWSIIPFQQPVKMTYALVGDDAGRVWVGSDAGLFRLQGNFVRDDRLPPNCTVNALLADGRGLLWAGTDQGLYLLKDSSATYFDNPSGGLGPDTILAVWDTRAGDVWVGTLNRGASRLHQGTWLSVTRQSTRDGLVDDIVLAGLEDSRGNLWFGTSKGLSYLWAGADPNDKTAWQTFVEPAIAGNRVNALWEDALRPGHIWVGTDRGLSLVLQNEASVFTRSDGLRALWTNALGQGKDGSLWIGSDSGLTYHRDFGEAPQVLMPDLMAQDQLCGLDCPTMQVAYDVGSINIAPQANDLGDLDGLKYSVIITPNPVKNKAPVWNPLKDISIFNVPRPPLFSQPVTYTIAEQAYDRDFNYSAVSQPKTLVVTPPTLWQWLGDHPIALFGLLLFALGLPILFYWYWDRWTMIRYPIALNIITRIKRDEQDGKLTLNTEYKLKRKGRHIQEKSFTINMVDGDREEMDGLIKENIRNPVAVEEDENAYKEIGKKLGGYLLDTSLEKELGGVLAKSNVSSVHLRLNVPISTATDHASMLNKWLRDLPWEYLCLSKSAEFLSKRNNFVIIRDLAGSDSMQNGPAPVVKQVKFLVACATLRDLPNLKEEYKDIKRTVTDARIESVEMLDANWDEFKEKVLSNEFQIIHFSGHGGYHLFDEGGEYVGQNMLRFSGSDGGNHPVSQDRLVDLFRQVAHGGDNEQGRLELIILNACRTAASDISWLSLAEALVHEAKVPAVVAMGYPISENTGAQFNAAFYSALFAKWHVAYAMLQTRKSLEFPHWGIPRLYTRVSDERILRFPIGKSVDDKGEDP